MCGRERKKEGDAKVLKQQNPETFFSPQLSFLFCCSTTNLRVYRGNKLRADNISLPFFFLIDTNTPQPQTFMLIYNVQSLKISFTGIIYLDVLHTKQFNGQTGKKSNFDRDSYLAVTRVREVRAAILKVCKVKN